MVLVAESLRWAVRGPIGHCETEIAEVSMTEECRAMEKLSLILWRERELLESLLFKLETERLVLAAGRERWLARAAREVESVLAAIRETEVLRAVAADEAAGDLGLQPNTSLKALAEAADEPWRTMLTDHREAFLRITQEVTALAEVNRDLLTAGHRAAQETLLSLSETTTGYSPTGDPVSASDHQPLLVDRSL